MLMPASVALFLFCECHDLSTHHHPSGTNNSSLLYSHKANLKLAFKLDEEMRPSKLNFGLICLKSELKVPVNLSEAS